MFTNKHHFAAAIVVLSTAVSHSSAQTPSSPVYTPGKLTPTQLVAREVFKELIEINTSVTTGNVTAGAVAMAKRFREAGIPESDIFIGGPRADKHNVVARYRGKNPAGRKPLLLDDGAVIVTGCRENTRSRGYSSHPTTACRSRKRSTSAAWMMTRRPSRPHGR
jgi:hypothetical protein